MKIDYKYIEDKEMPTIHQIVWHFFIFSFLGMIAENLFCLITAGKLESRKGFIFGPFCPIYGVGAIILIICMQWMRNEISANKVIEIIVVFILGGIIGSAFEYISSYYIQAMYGAKFWDYAGKFLNINGRTCFYFAISWGILSVLLMYIMKPIADRFIKYIEPQNLEKQKITDYILIIYMIINAIVTHIELEKYMERVSLAYNEGIYNDSSWISNEALEWIFPNMAYVFRDGIMLKNVEILSN